MNDITVRRPSSDARCSRRLLPVQHVDQRRDL